MDENIKEAFFKVKEDIFLIKQELNNLKKDLNETRNYISNLCEILKKLSKKTEKITIVNKDNSKKHTLTNLTHNLVSSSYIGDVPTYQQEINDLKPNNLTTSTRNEGVPTDKQTNQQTNQQTDKSSHNKDIKIEDPINKASEILNSLDNIKKELRLKFKRLTEQEFLVFSILYQLEEEMEHVSYKLISEKLNLTESSIRDYVGRLIKKGIPIDKIKINNKQINLKISQNLRKIAPLSTILQLRDL